MARPQADDYHDKRVHIMDVAADLFAKNGFHATSISDIAHDCATSKSRLYHYFSSKEQVLYEILRGHAQNLEQTLLPILEDEKLDARAKLESYANHLLLKNIKFKTNHKLILGEMGALRPAQRHEVAELLRRPIEALYTTLVEINPDMKNQPSLQFPMAMLFVGMINWTHTWFSGDGELTPNEFATLLCNTYLHGFNRLDFGNK